MRSATTMMAALLAAGAHAQPPEAPPDSTLRTQPAPAFARLASPFERAYLVDEGAHPFTRLFDGYRTDPRLVAGFDLDRHLAIEAGYREWQDRGFHALDPRSPLDTAGALGANGFVGYLAVKATLPLGDDLSAYGKLGLSHAAPRGGNHAANGVYGALGARYRLTDKASISVESRKFGGGAPKWGKGSNASGTSARLNLGF